MSPVVGVSSDEARRESLFCPDELDSLFSYFDTSSKLRSSKYHSPGAPCDSPRALALSGPSSRLTAAPRLPASSVREKEVLASPRLPLACLALGVGLGGGTWGVSGDDRLIPGSVGAEVKELSWLSGASWPVREEAAAPAAWFLSPQWLFIPTVRSNDSGFQHSRERLASTVSASTLYEGEAGKFSWGPGEGSLCEEMGGEIA